MATHSTAFIPTGRTPNEYMLSEGWSDGSIDWVGLAWYQSSPRMKEAIRGTYLLAGSPVFASPSDETLEIKEHDYIIEGIYDEVADYSTNPATLSAENKALIDSVSVLMEALEKGDWAAAEATAYAQMPIEAKMAKGFGLNVKILSITDFDDIPKYNDTDSSIGEYDLGALNRALDEGSEMWFSSPYFYHPTTGQWWVAGGITGHDSMMWVPLIIAFLLENVEPQVIEQLHVDYPEVYAYDRADLALFKASRIQ